ncbi:hypothetical protein SAY87_026205 [Trapa incisa]|uniref:DOMON domain-containing protein n=1 Tax=Trapa incisa TaxID=236973 RepID=A0AAN7GUK4_9MYRT|nr:hypothetical protein SAY87_026205 [Trapa incisa]
MTMAATHVSLLLGLALLSAFVGPSHSLVCTSQKLSNNRYSNCSDLPKLGASLHYTYNASDSSLSIAFIAAPASGGAWISWAINPTRTGMVGSQALMALKLSNGSVVAKTYNISGYHSIIESKLSFNVWDLTAEASSNGTMTIFATVEVPGNATSLNQVWQVGGAVNGNRPSIHPLEEEYKESMSKLVLAASDEIAPAPQHTHSSAVPVFSPNGIGIGLISCLALLASSLMLS